MTNPTPTPNPSHVAEICLYGAPTCGHGYLVALSGGVLLGTGDPVAGHSCTDAMWLAIIALHARGITSGTARVFAPGGARVADVDVARPDYFGRLDWGPAPVFVLSPDVIAASDASYQLTLDRAARGDRK